MNRKRKQCGTCNGDGRDRDAERRYQINSGASAWRHVPFLGHNCEDCNGTGWVPMDIGDET